MKKSLAAKGRKAGTFYKIFSEVISGGEIFQSSIVIAYYILFSIFPIIIIAGNILPLFHINTAPIAAYLSLIFPDQVSEFIMPIINSLLKSNSTGYISFGIILALWSFSNLVNAIRIGMNRLYGVHEVELKLSFLSFLWTRSFTVLLTTLMIIGFTGIGLVMIFGQQVLEFLRPVLSFSVGEIERIFSYRYLVVLLMMMVTVVYLNYVLPNIKLHKRIIWPGVIFTVFGWFALSYLFGFYLHNFPISWENYGIVGTFIIFMLWLNIISLLLLIGTSINATLIRLKYGKLEYSAGRVASFIQKKRHENK
ncbi:MAG: YihY/virulence factor BrkB family protein [Candidatus Lactobacillus pullistercoris]|uniref:YihY/virulence factor BrkB family protein n=1 Tax=Candidatus Lactobacillus pullistercoris TaxID=2838636 RepID=A0A9E2KTU1_9LACO|nr:YihY/virulence factor BrkB family protein [Candidatus Lactobacillus pullistercoris]